LVGPNVMASVAVFIALGGVAWAAATISSGDVINDTLKSVDLKDAKGVKDADVKADSLTGATIDESTLSQGGILTARLQVPFLTSGNSTFAPVSGVGTADPNESNVSLITPNVDLVASDFSMELGSPGTGGDARSFTLRVNSSDTAITCQIPIGGGVCQPQATAPVPANSKQSLEITDVGGTSANPAPAWFSFRLSPG
jgi:hypothetical protein